jgi:CBS domain-containing protein
MSMLVKQIMSTPVVTVSANAPLDDAIRLMLDRHISGLPVVADATGELQGILSEGDLLRRSEVGTGEVHHRWLFWLINPGALADDYVRANGLFVRDAMSFKVRSVSEQATAKDAVDVMERYKVKRLPVLRGHDLVGIVTRRDIVKALAGMLAPTYEEPATSDKEIRLKIEGELKAQTWAPAASVAVTVEGGIVQLYGAVFNDGQRRAIHVIAEHVPGVRQVHDHMIWVEPVSGTVLPSPEDSERRVPGL